MKIDLHNHTKYSFDSKSSMEDLILSAIDKNVYIFGFSDHLDFANNDPGANYYIADKQKEEFDKLKKIYKDKITLLLGIEASYENYYYDKIRKVIKQYNFDYIIMSVHFVENTVISKWIKKIEHNKDSIIDVDYSPYFEQMLELIENADFDILGHIDYYKKYSKFNHKHTFSRYIDYYESILKLLIKRNKILEVNTSGFRYECKEQFPQIQILKLYKELGGTSVSIGSDSHSIEQVAYKFDKAYSIIKSIGLKQFTVGGK